MRYLAVAPALALLLTDSPAGAEIRRDYWDQAEVDAMKTHDPHAAELFEKGEALAASGSLDEAYSLFRQVDAEVPYASIARRRQCEALTALGRRDEAIVACTRLGGRHTSNNQRALVRAFVDGPSPPRAHDLFMALAIIRLEGNNQQGDAPLPAAMLCEVAESIGDEAMLQNCAEKLQRVAPPGDPQALRIASLMQSRCPPWRFWAGWLAIAAAVLATIADAALRALSRRRSAATAVIATLVLCTLPKMAWGADVQPAARPFEVPHGWLSQWPIDEQHPEKGIPSEKERNADPLQFGYWLQDLILKASLASKNGDHEAAVRLYRALAQAVPDKAVSYSRLCDEYQALGNREMAATSCGQAILHDGAQVKDFTRFVRLTLAKQGDLSAEEKAALGKVIAHMKEDPEGRPFADKIECEVGARTSNLIQLRECTAALARESPESPETVTYQWALAVEERKFGQARALIERAKALGVPVDGMKQATTARQRRWLLRMFLAVVGGGLAAGGIAVAVRAVSRRRLTSNPKPAEAS